MNNHLVPYPYNQSGPRAKFPELCQRVASLLSRLHRWIAASSAKIQLPPRPLSVVCVSDTHNATPEIPDGDLFIHAGDLSQRGTFEELQAQLNWIRSLPHTFKVVIAGNHDLLLDQGFVGRFPHRMPPRPSCSPDDLSWGDIHYLQDEVITLKFEKHGGRELKIFGSPNTPEFGTWAFQQPSIRDMWTNTIPDDVDVVIAHGPPVLHLDGDRKGDGYFLRELRRVQPKLAVFGHIHDGYGEVNIFHDGVESSAEEITLRWRGICALVKMAFALWKALVDGQGPRYTKLVNAAVAAGEATHAKKSAISVLI